ncbi:hypothetical protein [Microbacterium wangruii]|uniref:hypothetical protein n=1 Tax=Microbacterium wangruii TaxID=3049073 RepID=UPI00256EFF84|nr:hypothetical protein [Microbacterium sp. zg-Y1211]MDL5487468.1 hypothetical protein [Microbacterium sp. zg-Y1211]
MQELFDLAFARIDRAGARRREFSKAWADYIAVHPWDIDVRETGEREFEILAVMREPAPIELSMIFSDWLSALRAALDNGLYAWVAAATGQNPPPKAERIQYPICSTPGEFVDQRKRLSGVPVEILDKLEKAQPYRSPYGPESNLTYWVHELARTDRHRAAHVGIGRVDEHRIRLRVPQGVTATFDETVRPYSHIEGELAVGRFITSKSISRFDVAADLTGVVIAPEIRAWADFTLNCGRQSLWSRMVYTEFFIRHHLENMAAFSDATPAGGFKTFDIDEAQVASADGR